MNFFYIENSQSDLIIGNYIKLYLLLHFDIESTLERMIIFSQNFKITPSLPFELFTFVVFSVEIRKLE